MCQRESATLPRKRLRRIPPRGADAYFMFGSNSRSMKCVSTLPRMKSA